MIYERMGFLVGTVYYIQRLPATLAHHILVCCINDRRAFLPDFS